MTRLLLALAAISAALTSVAGAQNAFPTRIALPNGFRARGHRDRRRAVLRRLHPDRRRLSRQPPNGQRRRPRPCGLRPRGDRDEGRPREAVRRGRPHGQRVRLQREDRCAHHVVCVLGRLRQRRRRHEAGCMVHGLVQAPPVPGAARPQRAPGRADDVHRGRPDAATTARVRTSTSTASMPRRTGRRSSSSSRTPASSSPRARTASPARSHSRAARAWRTATGSCSTGRRSTSCRTRWTSSRRSLSPRISGVVGSSGASATRRTSTSRRRSPSWEADCTP